MFRRLCGLRGLAIASAVVFAFGAQAADHHHPQSADHSTHHAPARVGKVTPATRAYKNAMKTMHKDMHVPLSGDADVDFVRQMIPHHQGAVDMARIQLKYGKDESVKRLNRWIIFTQELEIGWMKHWLARRDNGLSAKNAKDYYGEAMEVMHHAMMVPYTGDADVDYVRGMIAHHQGAVDMTSILMREGTDPDLKGLATDIFNSQTYEIAWMKRWLCKHKQH